MNPKKRLLLLAAGVAGVVLVAVALQGEDVVGSVDSKPVRSQHHRLADTRAAGLPTGAAQPLFISSEYRQQVRFGLEEDDQGVLVDDEVTVVDLEFDPSGGWFETESVYKAPFAVRIVESRIANELYVLGETTSGEWVIEAWRISLPEGSRSATRVAARSPIGTPFTTPATTVGIVGGGAFVPPALRSGAARLERTELFRGSSLGSIRDLAVDPDGRFLLVLSRGSGGLHRIGLDPPAPPVPVYSVVEIPNLTTSAAIYPLQHATDGRAYMLDPDLGAEFESKVTVLHDRDNDGVMDGHDSRTLADHHDMYPPGSWVDNFYLYLD